MQNKRFNVVYRGEIREGIDRDVVRKNIAAEFKLNDAKLEQLFSGKRLIVKKNSVYQDAVKLADQFNNCGAICNLEEYSDKTKNIHSADPKKPVANATNKKSADINSAKTRPPPVKKPTRLTEKEIQSLFKGKITRLPATFQYRFALITVSFFLLLIPVFYGTLIAGSGYLWGWYTINGFDIRMSGNPLISILLYIVPVLAGGIILVFLMRPIFLQFSREVVPLQLSPAEEPLFFTFIHTIADLVGAERPANVFITHDVNASAGFHRGNFGFLTKKLDLTIGIPIVEGTSLRQFAGILAHEFGHFSQGAGMRSSYLIRSILFWLYRAAYYRNHWDFRLEQLKNNEEALFQLVGHLAAFGIESSRWIMRVLLFIADIFSHYLMRHMEFDADRYETQMSGSREFGDTSYRIRLLSHAFFEVYNQLGLSWQDRKLVDDLPKTIVNKAHEIEPKIKQKILDEMQDEQTNYFDTHPADNERIDKARGLNAPGIFQLTLPSNVIFNKLEEYSKKVTRRFYSLYLGLSLKNEQLISVDDMNKVVSKEKEQADALSDFFACTPLQYRILRLSEKNMQKNMEKDVLKETLNGLVRGLREKIPEMEKLTNEFAKISDTALKAHMSDYLINLGLISDKLSDAAKISSEKAEIEKKLVKFDDMQMERMEYALGYRLRAGDENIKQKINRLIAAQAILADARDYLNDLCYDMNVLHHLYSYDVYNRQQYPDDKDTVYVSSHIYANCIKRIEGDIDALVSTLGRGVFPFDTASDKTNLYEYFLENMPIFDRESINSVIQFSISLYDNSLHLNTRIMKELVFIAVSVEKELGVEPLKFKIKKAIEA